MSPPPCRRSVRRGALVALVCFLLVPGTGALPSIRFAFSILSADYRDLDGDRDPFPDTGETGRVRFTVRIADRAQTGVTFVLVSSDPDVACITERRVAIGDLAAGQILTVGSLDPSLPGFTFQSSDALNSPSGADAARIELCLRVDANEIGALSDPVCTSLLADVDQPPGVTQTFVPGPDGVPGSTDDGTLLENFDTDRDADGLFTVNDTFLINDAGTGRTEHGFYQRGSNPPAGAGAVPGIACGGFRTPADGNPACILDPDFPMDWHLHCPPNATDCPNVETGTCAEGCSYATPHDGQKALSFPNSLHMGAHFDPMSSWNGDTTHLRALQGFVSAPLNLALFPRPGDLELSMFQIADLMDNNGMSPSNTFHCLDCGDVQVQIDRDSDPAVDDWGSWDNLAPFQNGYDHVRQAWSVYGSYYCEFTPADTGMAPPAPRGAHETMCFPQGVWSHCGTVRGTVAASTGDCPGPGIVDPSGTGVWVQTRFDLGSYLGQRIRIRWIGSTWMMDGSAGSYLDLTCGWGCTFTTDDGWWLDDIQLGGVLASQASPLPDTRPAPPTSCPALCPDVDDDGYGSPGSALCPAGSTTDCNDLDTRVHPGAAEICDGLDDNCDGVIPSVEADADNDGWRVCGGDCDDADPWTYPDAPEANDGRDNQCPGSLGFGAIDEISGSAGFSSATRPDDFCWQGQHWATSYLVARSTQGDFARDCVTLQSVVSCVSDPTLPPLGGVFFYLVRAQAPHFGSWGQDSSGKERMGICGLVP
jgi:hypothetical protein